MTLRDESGRFRKAAPDARIKAHVQRVNERHPDVPFVTRSQPLQYEDSNSRWPLILGAGFVAFILVTAIWVMTH